MVFNGAAGVWVLVYARRGVTGNDFVGFHARARGISRKKYPRKARGKGPPRPARLRLTRFVERFVARGDPALRLFPFVPELGNQETWERGDGSAGGIFRVEGKRDGAAGRR